MSARKDFTKEARKTKPYTVRFSLTFAEDIKKHKGLVKGQAIADFLVDLYNQTFNPIVGNPVIERNVSRETFKDMVAHGVGITHISEAGKPRHIPVASKEGQDVIAKTKNVPRGTQAVPQAKLSIETPKEPVKADRIEELKQLIADAKSGKTKFMSVRSEKAHIMDWTKELKTLQG
jgi:hypothetical protein